MPLYSYGTLSSGFLLCCLLLSLPLAWSIPDGDLCRWMNGRKYYIDIGESGLIVVENATSLTSKGSTSDPQLPQIPQRCSVELITCPSCHLEIGVQRLAIPTCSTDKTCRCDFLWIKESAYSKSGREFCGFKENGSTELVYESKTKLVSIDFLYSGSYKEAFVLQFNAKKNLYIYKGGYDSGGGSNGSGMIQSPNFPGGYPSDYSAEFVLQNVDLSGFVQLIFTDFQLSLWSYVEIFDSNGTRIDVYNGNTFRPPAIISSGSTLTVKFQANDEYPSTGFQAQYKFVSFPERFWIHKPSTDCGGFVEDFGGAITMMNMVPAQSIRLFDCIWLIRPRNSHVPETQVSIRVAQFEEMGTKSTLTIRQGQHSDAPLLESVTSYQHQKMPRGQEFVVPATSGFYIRLVGYFTNKSHLAIIYTTFRYEGCYAISDFECDNGRCIKSALRCDGFNNCDDGSDEATCYGTNLGTALPPEDANWWRTLTPNYYFPKPESTSGAGTNTLILVTSLAGLGMFVLTTVMILVKLHRQRSDDTISREILHTISADLEAENSPSHQGLSDLPLYDPPPSYEDVIKLYLPPPPPYSSISRNRPRINCSRTAGVENRGYRNDSPNTRGQHRRSRAPHSSRIVPQDGNHPLILKVALPEEAERNHISTNPPRNITCDNNGLINAYFNSPDEQPITQEHIQKSYDSDDTGEIIKVNATATSDVINQLSSSLLNETINKEIDPVQFCECQGACSCKLINTKKQIDRSSSDSKAGIRKNKQHLLGIEKVTKKRSFKDMMQKGTPQASSSAIIPHPASMTITVRPARSKKSGKKDDESKCKSAGPSSPTSTHPEYESNYHEYEHSYSSERYLGHRRSSSGPSELSASVDGIAKQPITNTTEKQASENDLPSEQPHSYKVRNMASVLLDGLHQSFSFRNEDAEELKEDEKSKLPPNWTNLWMLRKKLPAELGETSQPKTEKQWTACDTLPLLSNGSSQSAIVKFDDKSSVGRKAADSNQIFKETVKTLPNE